MVMYVSFSDFIVLLVFVVMAGCTSEASRRSGNQPQESRKLPIERLGGEADIMPSIELLDKGRVLMSYSDCATCHKEADRKRGPAFEDIAARYPMNSTYINILAKRIMLGTKGTWGNVVMPPHPTLSEKDAETMVMYILSLARPD
ncbi:hypothetical protein GCM10007415_44650 [Parapedobacter pyrenivorans]|uniref:Cytochrome c domain-containing protein n=2 Tax=Parapedobacter pyrenivorans TaxID=1305674 RepID=A0A917I355_9SPHI|nr:hypothetical protein GCM10007415_44650 [Parapedobacter pyrenivorans]